MSTQPTVLLHGDDAGDSYYFWQWLGEPATEPQTHVVPHAVLAPLLERLTASLPGPIDLPDDATPEQASAAERAMITGVLEHGVFARYDSELAFSRELGRAVLPVALAAEIVAASRGGRRVLLRVLPSPSCARIPWELLPVLVDGEERRLVELADIATDPPVGLHAERTGTPGEWTAQHAAAPVAYVIDPKTTTQGAIFESTQLDALHRRRGDRAAPPPGGSVTRQQLSAMLRAQPAPSRLLYVGHVASSAEQPGATSMMLSDSARAFGVVRAIGGADRPFSAFDLVEGTLRAEDRLAALTAPPESIAEGSVQWPTGAPSRESGAAIWPMPPRVALIACNSGGDLANPEPFGLALALLNAGAGLVTATRWTLPTDRAFRRDDALAAGDPQPLLELALAVNARQAGADPVAEIAAWQRDQLAAWQRTAQHPDVSRSPLLWAAVTTYLGPHKPPTALARHELAALLGDSA